MYFSCKKTHFHPYLYSSWWSWWRGLLDIFDWTVWWAVLRRWPQWRWWCWLSCLGASQPWDLLMWRCKEKTKIQGQCLDMGGLPLGFLHLAAHHHQVGGAAPLCQVHSSRAPVPRPRPRPPLSSLSFSCNAPPLWYRELLHAVWIVTISTILPFPRDSRWHRQGLRQRQEQQGRCWEERPSGTCSPKPGCTPWWKCDAEMIKYEVLCFTCTPSGCPRVKLKTLQS